MAVLFGLVLQFKFQMEALPGLCCHSAQKPLDLVTLMGAGDGLELAAGQADLDPALELWQRHFLEGRREDRVDTEGSMNRAGVLSPRLGLRKVVPVLGATDEAQQSILCRKLRGASWLHIPCRIEPAEVPQRNAVPFSGLEAQNWWPPLWSAQH